MTNSTPLIEMRGITKRFGGVTALDDLSLQIMPGEIHCLAGENGSGKSTIIKVMSGVYQPDGGSVFIDGQPAGVLDPVKSTAAGIQVIYQDFSLFPTLSVVENLTINSFLREGARVVDRKRARQMAREVLARLDVDLPLDAAVETLPTSGRQLVAIARAVLADARLIIMDEPTTLLDLRNARMIGRVISELSQTVVLATHHLYLLDDFDRVLVFDSGRLVADAPPAEALAYYRELMEA